MKIHFMKSLKPLKGCAHGPQVWPWWKLFSLFVCRLGGIHQPSTGYRLWIYMRKIGAICFDVYFDRRKL